jgi:hypothetical protein
MDERRRDHMKTLGKGPRTFYGVIAEPTITGMRMGADYRHEAEILVSAEIVRIKAANEREAQQALRQAMPGSPEDLAVQVYPESDFVKETPSA